MAIIKKPGFGSSGRYRSGKQLRQVLGTTVYAWRPTPPDYIVKNSNALSKKSKDVVCCENCDGLTVDNCVTYVNGGTCGNNTGTPTNAAYVECDYVT